MKRLSRWTQQDWPSAVTPLKPITGCRRLRFSLLMLAELTAVAAGGERSRLLSWSHHVCYPQSDMKKREAGGVSRLWDVLPDISMCPECFLELMEEDVKDFKAFFISHFLAGALGATLLTLGPNEPQDSGSKPSPIVTLSCSQVANDKRIPQEMSL